ncbi:MAG: hypothetical protein HC858_07435 [Brachymonas sp.]|nr:hypothetical protein [Brachymonas sp.]
MSQHVLQTKLADVPVEILLGWDRRLSYFFMVIERASNDGDEEPIYSNLNEQEPFKKSLTFYRLVLERLGVAVPEALWLQVACDRDLNVGNRFVIWQADGRFDEK